MREMKDSGIEWIGKIPSNWMFARIGSLYGLRQSRRLVGGSKKTRR